MRIHSPQSMHRSDRIFALPSPHPDRLGRAAFDAVDAAAAQIPIQGHRMEEFAHDTASSCGWMNTVIVTVVPTRRCFRPSFHRCISSYWAGPSQRQSPKNARRPARWTTPPAWQGRYPDAGPLIPENHMDRIRAISTSISPPPAWMTILISPSYMAIATFRMISGANPPVSAPF